MTTTELILLAKTTIDKSIDFLTELKYNFSKCIINTEMHKSFKESAADSLWFYHNSFDATNIILELTSLSSKLSIEIIIADNKKRSLINNKDVLDLKWKIYSSLSLILKNNDNVSKDYIQSKICERTNHSNWQNFLDLSTQAILVKSNNILSDNDKCELSNNISSTLFGLLFLDNTKSEKNKISEYNKTISDLNELTLLKERIDSLIIELKKYSSTNIF